MAHKPVPAKRPARARKPAPAPAPAPTPTPAAEPPAPKTGLELLTDSVTKIGIIIGAVFTLNTSISSCSEADMQRAARYNTAVANEEAYWKALYEAYGNAMKKDVDGDERVARVLAIYALSGHPTPDFSSYRLGLLNDLPEVKRAAAEHLAELRRSLRTAIQNNAASNGAIGAAVREADFASEEATKLRPREGAAVLAKAIVETKQARAETSASAGSAPAGTINYAAQVMSVGSPTGWDVDVYWCAGADGGTNYGVAKAAAELLGRQADAVPAAPLAPGVALGRVRLRSLPEARQQDATDYPLNGISIVFDGGKYEFEVAKLLQARLTPTANFRYDLVQSRTVSKWYLSIFVCKLHPNAPMAAPKAAATPTPVRKGRQAARRKR